MPSFPKNEEFDGSRLISLDCNESKQAGNAKCIACMRHTMLGHTEQFEVFAVCKKNENFTQNSVKCYR